MREKIFMFQQRTFVTSYHINLLLVMLRVTPSMTTFGSDFSLYHPSLSIIKVQFIMLINNRS